MLEKESLEGEELQRMFYGAIKCLAVHFEILNDINVFPVPDGDTGSNMLTTLEAIKQEIANILGRTE